MESCSIREGREGPGADGLLRRTTFHIGPDLIFLALFAALLAAMEIVYGGGFILLRSSFIMSLVTFAILAAIGVATRLRRGIVRDSAASAEAAAHVLGMMRDWFPLVLIVLIYENLHDYTYLIRPHTVDASLRAVDERIFGVEPTLALQRIVTPWLTEYMTFVYALCFVFPAFILGRLYFRGEFFKFREFGLGLSIVLYVGFTLYILVPAIGPRYFMAAEFTVPLEGIWLTSRAAAVWNSLEKVQRDCFPSLHTALTTFALIYLWRYRDAWRRGGTLLLVCLPLIVSLWFSTIYLRYHWAIDVLAGWALAWAASRVAPAFIRWYYCRRLGRAVEVSIDG